MAKAIIKGRFGFATAEDAATFYGISEARRRHLDDEIDKAIAKTAAGVSPATTSRRKRTRPKHSGKTVGVRAKRK